MRFGPEGDPRQRRAYTHMMLARASNSSTAKDFYFAERAVLHAGTSAKTSASHFKQDLDGIERNMVMPKVTLQNRTECDLMFSVIDAFSTSDIDVNFHSLFGRPNTLASDRELAEQFLPFAEVQYKLLYRTKFQPAVSAEGGWRKPKTLDSFRPFVAKRRNAQKFVDMTFLVALQPEIPEPPLNYNTSLAENQEAITARAINISIAHARLMAEIMLENFANTGQSGTNTPLPTTVLSERYLAQRDQLRNSIIPYMADFEDNLRIEFTDAVQGAAGGRFSPLETIYERGDINKAYAKLDAYKAVHANLPWQQK